MLDGGKELMRDRVSTPNNYKEIISTIFSLINRAEESVNIECSIGICTPGSLSLANGLLRNSNTTCLNNTPFKFDLEKSIGREIRIENDANCFALSEAIDGTAEDANTVFGVIVGTGTGGGVVINKKVLIGANAIAGEWGHNSLPWPNEGELALNQCWCGQQGCIETFLSGPGLENDYKRATGDYVSAVEIVKLSELGNVDAEKVLRRYENRMARCLAQVINIFDPDVIVLGGGMSNLQRLYMNVPKLWQQWIFSEQVVTKLVPPKYGDSSGVRGAAWLWND